MDAGLRQFILMFGPLVALIAASPLGQRVHLTGGWAWFVAYASTIATVVSFLWGQWETRRSQKQKVIMAAAAPNSVAVVK